MVIYDSAYIYIESATSLAEKVTKCDEVIAALFAAAAKAGATEDITEYSLDDGQTKIRTVYRGTAAVFASINVFERLKQSYLNKLNGRTVQLRDSKNFRNRC